MTSKIRKFTVSKRFTSGHLAGLTVSEQTDVEFEVGETIEPWAYGPSGYVVESVEVNA